MHRGYRYYLTPMLLVIMACIFMICWSISYSERTGGWSLLAGVFFFVLLLFVTAVYFLARAYSKQVADIWIIELIALAGVVLVLGAFLR